MKVNVASLKQPTFHAEYSFVRNEEQSLEEYLHQEIERRIELVKKGVIEASLKKDTNVPLFFTLPEFFWNVKWNALKNKGELNQFTSYMLDSLSDAQERLMSELPESQYGKVVLLAGTVATLVENEKENVFEALNYCLISNNFMKTSDGRYAKSAWPKRSTSHIDFGVKDSVTERGFVFTLNEGLTIEVLNKTDHVAEHDTADGLGLKLDNTTIQGCPFSINLCLDYSVVKPGERDNEVVEPVSKIDFLMACGMSLSADYQYPESVRFAVRNDGMGNGEVEYYSIKNRHLFRKVAHTDLSDALSLVEFTIS